MMNKRKQRDFEEHLESVDIELINSLKKKTTTDTTKVSTSIDENKFFLELLDKTLNINLVCDKKKKTKNCIENPNCFHHLGQKNFLTEHDTYIKENLMKDFIRKQQSISPSSSSPKITTSPSLTTTTTSISTTTTKPTLTLSTTPTPTTTNTPIIKDVIIETTTTTTGTTSKENEEVYNTSTNVTPPIIENTSTTVVAAESETKAIIDEQDDIVLIKSSPNEFREVKERDISIQPIGLKNLGATCYANSLLQLLFMNKEFRKLVLEIKLPKDNQMNGVISNSNDSEKDIIIDQLRLLFLNMQFNRNSIFDPTEFITSLQLSNSMHQDIQEFFILFLGLIESQLDNYNLNSGNGSDDNSVGSTNFLKQLFQGLYNYTTECSSCHSKYKSPSSFYEIQLQLEGFDGLEESLRGFLSKEKLTGDDKYFCTKCKTKKNCSRSIELSQIPPYLCFQLLRYSFDKTSFKKKKLHNPFSFPLELDIKKVISNNIGISDDDNDDDDDNGDSKDQEMKDSDETDEDIIEEEDLDETENEIEQIKKKKQTVNSNSNGNGKEGIGGIKDQFYVLKDAILEENQQDESIYNQVAFYRIVKEIIKNRNLRNDFNKVLQLFKSDLFLSKYKDAFIDIVKYNSTNSNGSDNENQQHQQQITEITKPICMDNTGGGDGSLIDQDQYIYELTGILMHQGSSTGGGHYICHIKDDTTGIWWKFNDETIEEIDIKNLGKDSKSEKRKKVEIDAGTISSSSAYMVVYSKKNRVVNGNGVGGANENQSQNPLQSYDNLSDRLLDKLQEMDNTFNIHKSLFDTEFRKLKIQWEQRIELFQKVEPYLNVDYDQDDNMVLDNKKSNNNNNNNGKRSTHGNGGNHHHYEEKEDELIEINDDDTDSSGTESEMVNQIKEQTLIEKKLKKQYYWIDTDWLKNWIVGYSFPIDNSPLQCTHSLLNPSKLVSMKRISPIAWKLLHDASGGGPTFSESSVCSECLYSLCSESKEKASSKSLKEYYISIEKPQPKVTSKRVGSRQPYPTTSTNNVKKEYYISKNWFNNWKKVNQQNDEQSPTEDIICPHGGLNLDEKDRLQIAAETWVYLKSLYPDDTCTTLSVADSVQCTVCTEQANDLQEKEERKLLIAKEEKKEMKELLALLKSKPRSKKPNLMIGQYCAVSKDWLANWESLIFNPNQDDTEELLYNENGERVDKDGFQLLDQDTSVDKLKESIGTIDNSSFICKDHSKFQYDLSDENSIKQLSTFSLTNNTNSFNEFELPFLLIPKSSYDKLASKYGSNIDIQLSNGNLVEPYTFCGDCFKAQQEIELKKKLNFNGATIYIHKINGKDNQYDMKYYSFPTSFRMPRSYRHEISPVNHDYSIEQLKLTICSILGTSTYQQRLFMINEPIGEDDKQGIIELKESAAQLRWYKIVPNQIIVLKIDEDGINSFIEDSYSCSSNSLETGFKGSIFNK